MKNIDNIKYYLEWKKNIQLYIRKCYSVIKWEIMSFKGRECMFRNELKDQISNAKKTRNVRKQSTVDFRDRDIFLEF